jgi:hypothetical protein
MLVHSLPSVWILLYENTVLAQNVETDNSSLIDKVKYDRKRSIYMRNKGEHLFYKPCIIFYYSKRI